MNLNFPFGVKKNCQDTDTNKSHIQEMYINVGMANREKRPKQERDDIRFTTHIAISTSFYILHFFVACCSMAQLFQNLQQSMTLISHVFPLTISGFHFFFAKKKDSKGLVLSVCRELGEVIWEEGLGICSPRKLIISVGGGGGVQLSPMVPTVVQIAVVAKSGNYLSVFVNVIEFHHCCSSTHIPHSLNCSVPSFSACVHVSG